MTTKITKDLLLARKGELAETRGKVEKQAAPLRDKRDKLQVKAQALEAEIGELTAEIRKIEAPLYDIDMERSMIAKALPGARTIHTAAKTKA